MKTHVTMILLPMYWEHARNISMTQDMVNIYDQDLAFLSTYGTPCSSNFSEFRDLAPITGIPCDYVCDPGTIFHVNTTSRTFGCKKCGAN